MLRLEAERFHAAEYDEPVRGRRPSLLRRLAWYVLGVAGVARPAPRPSGRRAGPVPAGRGSVRHPRWRSCSAAWASARRSRSRCSTTGGCASRTSPRTRAPSSTRSSPRSSTRPSSAAPCSATSRGPSRRRTRHRVLRPASRSSGQAVVYVARHAPRGAGPGQVHARAGPAHRPRRWLGDAPHRRHRRGVPRPCDHPRRGLPHDRPRRPAAGPRHRGRGRRAAPPHARRAGARSTGPASATVDARAGCGGGAASRGPRRRSRSTSTSRSASRTARTATSSSSPVARRAGRRIESRRSSAALRVELELRADALDERFGPPGAGSAGARRSTSLYLGGGTPSLLDGRCPGARSSISSASDSGSPRCRGHPRGEPGTGRARRPSGSARRRRDAAVDRRPEPRCRGARERSGAGTGPAMSRRPSARPATPASTSSASTCCTTCPASRSTAGRATLDAALRPRAGPPLAVRPDPRRPRRGGPHRPDRRPPARPARRPSLARRARALAQDEDRAAAMYELADQRLAAAGFEWYEISNWARPGQRSRHNLAYWQGQAWEAVGPGAHAFDGAAPSLECGPARRLPRRAHAARWRPAATPAGRPRRVPERAGPRGGDGIPRPANPRRHPGGGPGPARPAAGARLGASTPACSSERRRSASSSRSRAGSCPTRSSRG